MRRRPVRPKTVAPALSAVPVGWVQLRAGVWQPRPTSTDSQADSGPGPTVLQVRTPPPETRRRPALGRIRLKYGSPRPARRRVSEARLPAGRPSSGPMRGANTLRRPPAPSGPCPEPPARCAALLRPTFTRARAAAAAAVRRRCRRRLGAGTAGVGGEEARPLVRVGGELVVALGQVQEDGARLPAARRGRAGVIVSVVAK